MQVEIQQKKSYKNQCVVVIGMSGTGKTTFVQKFNMINKYNKIHCVNLDPAVKILHYEPFLDIRKDLHYKKVMKQYKLGPNGAIMTALNLFTAQPQKFVNEIKKKIQQNPQDNNLFLIDIPGQIEVFTWSASSLILTAAISTLMPVKLFYIVDAVRCQNPNVFLSNLLFAQSIEYRLKKYQFVLLINKIDCADGEILTKWMLDYQQFMVQLNKDPAYLSTLSKSIVIHLSDFYQKNESQIDISQNRKRLLITDKTVKLMISYELLLNSLLRIKLLYSFSHKQHMFKKPMYYGSQQFNILPTKLFYILTTQTCNLFSLNCIDF